MRFLLGRLGFYLLAAWVTLTVNFVLPRLMPGDPAAALFARFQGRLSPQALQSLQTAFGLSHASLASQYWSYLARVAHGDLGISIAYFPASVEEVVASGLLWTLFLAGGSLVVSYLLGSLLGIAVGWWRGGWLDSILPPALAFLGAFPYFWLAMVMLYLGGFVAGWFPLGHAYRDDLTPGFNAAFALDVLRHAELPMASIVLATLGGWLLTMRNSLISVLGSDYIRLAWAKGLSPPRVVFRYAVRNALLPSLASFGMSLGFVLGGSLLTEIVFSYPGQGYLLVQAVRGQDFPLMQGIFLAITLSVLGANFLVDVLTAWLDPRTAHP